MVSSSRPQASASSAAPLGLSRPDPRQQRAWTWFSGLGTCLVIVVFWLAGEVGSDQAVADVQARARNSAALKVTILMNELEKQRALPFVLAQDIEVRQALRHRSPDAIDALDAKLLALQSGTGASVIYLIDAKGVAIAASNWRETTSFVGNDYAFRPYFQDAMRSGAAEHFALGNTSQRPGLFLTRRIDGDDGPLGIIVVKVEFDDVVANWRRFPEPTFVTDEHGVVLLSAVPGWQFMTFAAAPESELQAVRASLQFGDASLTPLPIQNDPDTRRGEGVLARLPDAGWDEPFVHVETPVPTTRWTFHFLGPTREATARASVVSQTIGVLLTLLLLFAAGLILHRRHVAADEIAAQKAIRAELESRVSARTAELREANQHLVTEMDDRRRAEAGLHQLQDELVQANKLAFLGQITAGVAHEINQPVAAIRSFADNAAVFLARDNLAQVQGNLVAIADLTQRIGTITEELRTFSRKATGSLEATDVDAAVAGALLLVGNPMHRQGVTLRVPDAAEAGLRVMAERVRLEQVLVNLLQNALDALVGRAGGEIVLGAQAVGEQVRIHVQDNGPGIAPEVMAALYTPFVTTKAQGLGLGLVISRDIIAEFGGELQVESPPAGGTLFTLVLRKAPI